MPSSTASGSRSGPARRSRRNARADLAQHAIESAREARHFRIAVEPSQSRSGLGDRRIDELQKSRVVLDAVDEHEASGVLELPLDGHEVELPAELRTRRGVESQLTRVLVEA